MRQPLQCAASVGLNIITSTQNVFKCAQLGRQIAQLAFNGTTDHIGFQINNLKISLKTK